VTNKLCLRKYLFLNEKVCHCERKDNKKSEKHSAYAVGASQFVFSGVYVGAESTVLYITVKYNRGIALVQEQE
jgi:hypothetical protein